MVVSERNYLPGGPSNRLVKEVRRTLWLNFQCRPGRDSDSWYRTWKWAAAVCNRCDSFNRVYGINQRSKPWPTSNEIATQYMLICMAEAHKYFGVRIHRRATECLENDEASQFVRFLTDVFKTV